MPHARPQHGRSLAVPTVLNTPAEDAAKTDGKAKATRKEGGRPRPGLLQGWLAMARPPAGAVRPRPSHLLGGNRLWPRPPIGAATRRFNRLQRSGRRSDDLQRGAHPQRRSPVGTTPMGGPADQVAT
ncbi:hypothetical protein GW17_00027123 [Ensete ventricosum]|nr:hypothetical protein GW17_00027123 [Ensete ventricosum]